MSVSEFIKTNQERELFVVLMDDEYIFSESEDEQAQTKNLKEEIIDCIIKSKKEITYEKNIELIIQYGFDCKKRIEKQKKEHP